MFGFIGIIIQPHQRKTRWWFHVFFNFHLYLGKIPIFTGVFQLGWNHQLEAGFGLCLFVCLFVCFFTCHFMVIKWDTFGGRKEAANLFCKFQWFHPYNSPMFRLLSYIDPSFPQTRCRWMTFYKFPFCCSCLRLRICWPASGGSHVSHDFPSDAVCVQGSLCLLYSSLAWGDQVLYH